jgi:outer membrane protein assembly factor BamB
MTMRARAVVAVVVGLLGVPAAMAQHPLSATYTRPNPLPRAVLDRLNLRMGWSTTVPTDGVRDGLQSVDVLGPADLLVQTRSGTTILLDAETGDVRWRSRVGLPYHVHGHPVANTRNIYVINGTDLYALDRATGAVQWQFGLPAGITAPPAVDNEFIYLATAEGRLDSYLLPVLDAPLAAAKAKPATPLLPQYERNKKTTGTISHLTTTSGAGAQVAEGPQPTLFWEYATNMKVEVAPLVATNAVFAVGADGEAVAMTRVPQQGENQRVKALFTFQADGPVRVRPGQFQDVAYLASNDGSINAINLHSGRVLWRHTGAAGSERTPAVFPDDVYVVNRGDGLARLDRATGAAMWRVPRGNRLMESNVEADRFLAANPKFVYAADHLGRLLVLDRRLGHRLSGWDTRDFVVHVRNDVTDRLFLAANNGLIVCLHDREYTAPLHYRQAEADVPTVMRQLLAQPVTDPGGAIAPLSDVLQGMRTRYQLKIEVLDRAFKEADLPPIGPIPVKFPKVENRPLSEVLQRILDQVGATFQLAGDTLRIIPQPPKPKGR